MYCVPEWIGSKLFLQRTVQEDKQQQTTNKQTNKQTNARFVGGMA